MKTIHIMRARVMAITVSITILYETMITSFGYHIAESEVLEITLFCFYFSKGVSLVKLGTFEYSSVPGVFRQLHSMVM